MNIKLLDTAPDQEVIDALSEHVFHLFPSKKTDVLTARCSQSVKCIRRHYTGGAMQIMQ